MAAAIKPIDGRVARTERTRRAVVDALLDLLNEGDLRPTAARIAERAGVSLRLVFHHFDDLETLYNEVGDRILERVRPLLTPIPLSLPLARRIEAFTMQRGRMLETVTPVRRGAILMEPFRPALAKRLKIARERARAATLHVFSPELAKMPACDKREIAAALDFTTSWMVWEQMRRYQGLSEIEARKVMARTVRALIGGRSRAQSTR